MSLSPESPRMYFLKEAAQDEISDVGKCSGSQVESEMSLESVYTDTTAAPPTVKSD